MCIIQEEQGSSGTATALESACTGATSAASELERALVAAARDQARDLAPLADEAKRLASDLAYIGKQAGIQYLLTLTLKELHVLSRLLGFNIDQ